jgi:hypothetical protein
MKLKDMFGKKRKPDQPANAPGDPDAKSPAVERSLAQNEQWLAQTFSRCHDVKIIKMEFASRGQTISALLVYGGGLMDEKQLNETVLPSLRALFDQDGFSLQEQYLLRHWSVTPLTTARRLADIVNHVFSGYLAMFFDGLNTAFVLDISNPPQRQTEESRTELSILGPRDSFTEDLSMNVALVRKRLKTNSFCFEQYTIGRRTKTKVGLLYIDDIIRPEILQEVRERLAQIDVDSLISVNKLQELLSRPSGSLFPLFDYTGRPDFVVSTMLRGRFALLVDGNPTAIIAPANLSLLYKTPEDMHITFFYATFGRLLRILGLLISLFLPGLFVAIVTFHQDQIPLTLLATLVVNRKGTPFPTPLEAFLMIVLLELFREAGLRLPSPIGQTLAVVGGLIIGDAAIRAGLTSPAMLVIIGTTAVASFSLVNQSLSGAVSVFRILIIFASSILGVVGFLLGTFTLLVYMSNLRSFGVPYLAPVSPLSFSDFLNVFFRSPEHKIKNRPAFLNTLDNERSGNGDEF